VAQKINRLIGEGSEPNEIGILFRDNNDANLLVNYLEKLGIRYDLKSNQNMLDNRYVKQLISILRTLNSYGDEVLLTNLLHLSIFNLEPLDIYKILRTLSQLKEPGVYHIACSNLTTPYKFGQLLAEKLGITESVKSSSVREYMKSPQTVRRLIRGGLETKLTQQQLQITFATWQENLDEYVRLHKEKLNSLFESS